MPPQNVKQLATDFKRDPRYKQALRSKAARLYRQGLTIGEIAKRLGVSKGRAYILALEGGADMRRRGPG